eukprot:gene3534-1819_t
MLHTGKFNRRLRRRHGFCDDTVSDHEEVNDTME